MTKKHQLLSISENSYSSIYMWSLSFYNVGKQTIYLKGFKNNKIVLTDSVNINIHDKKDYLNFNWNEVQQELGRISWNDKGNLPNHFSVTLNVKDKKPYIHLFTESEDSNSLCDCIEHKNILYNYITNLYGNNKYSVQNTPDIKEIFKSSFKIYKEQDEVFNIWETRTSRIALLKKHNTDYSFTTFMLKVLNR